MSDATLFGQAIANLRGLSVDIHGSGDAGLGPVQATLHGWSQRLDSAIADLLEVQRRALYTDVLAVGAALVDVMAEGPPDPAEGIQPSMDFGLFPAA